MEAVAWELEEVVMVQALEAFSQELDRRLPKEVLQALCYHMEGLEELCLGQEEFLEAQELELQSPPEHLLFLRQDFQEGLLVVLERKLPKCQVWVCLDFIKVDWCQEKDLVDVEFCLGWPLVLTLLPSQLEEEDNQVKDQEAAGLVDQCSQGFSMDTPSNHPKCKVPMEQKLQVANYLLVTAVLVLVALDFQEDKLALDQSLVTLLELA